MLKNIDKELTQEEIVSIKANLKKAFGDEYITIDTNVKTLYKDKKCKFKKGELYHYYNAIYDEEMELGKGWYTIKLTLVRSGVCFFTVLQKEKKNEYFFSSNSIFADRLIPNTINIKKVGISKGNLPIIKFCKGKCPYDVNIVNNDEIIMTI